MVVNSSGDRLQPGDGRQGRQAGGVGSVGLLSKPWAAFEPPFFVLRTCVGNNSGAYRVWHLDVSSLLPPSPRRGPDALPRLRAPSRAGLFLRFYPARGSRASAIPRKAKACKANQHHRPS